MKRLLIPSCAIVGASVLLPACTALDNARPVEVRLRDAQTQAPIADAHYHIQQTTPLALGPDIPAVELSHTASDDGTLDKSHIRWQMFSWYQTQVTIKGDGYGESRFSFVVAPWDKRGAAANGWKRAHRVTQDGREIEYQIAYP